MIEHTIKFSLEHVRHNRLRVLSEISTGEQFEKMKPFLDILQEAENRLAEAYKWLGDNDFIYDPSKPSRRGN